MSPLHWDSIWPGKDEAFLASKFEDFEYLQPAELPSDIRMSLPEMARERAVPALTKTMKPVSTLRAEGDALFSVQETLLLIEDDPAQKT
jgi:hypothetical protein